VNLHNDEGFGRNEHIGQGVTGAKMAEAQKARWVKANALSSLYDLTSCSMDIIKYPVQGLGLNRVAAYRFERLAEVIGLRGAHSQSVASHCCVSETGPKTSGLLSCRWRRHFHRSTEIF
jgi:hypothetical protein